MNISKRHANGKTAIIKMITCIILLVFSILGFTATFGTKDVETSVFRIVNFSGHLEKRNGTGTGFKIADPGIVVTNYHVIAGARTLGILSPSANRDDFKINSSKVLWHDRDRDLAILASDNKLPGAPLTLAKIALEDLKKTDRVTAIGFPGVADQLAHISTVTSASTQVFLDPSISTGTIERLLPSAIRLTIQHSANINPGNSGGPLFDDCQRVIGVNTLSTTATIRLDDVRRAIATGSASFQTPGALESSVHIREVLDSLHRINVNPTTSGGRCYLGIDRSEITILAVSFTLLMASVTLGVSSWRDHGRGQQTPVAQPNDSNPADTTYIASPWCHGTMVFRSLQNTGDATLQLNDPSLDDTGTTIGRHGGGADLLIHDTDISRLHARIRRIATDRFELTDLASTNGTWVNDVPVVGSSPALVTEGSIIRFGRNRYRIEIITPSELCPEEEWLLSGFDGTGRLFQYRFCLGGHSSIRTITIGRSSSNDMIIDDASVSRQHARITIRGNKVKIEDLNSSNGTLLNKNKINSKEYPLIIGMELQFGEISASLSKYS